MSSVSNYAKNILVAEELIKLGCKWPIVHEMLGIRISDAQRLVRECDKSLNLLSRAERGLYWWRAPGKHNLRMTHANFLYRLYLHFNSELSLAEKLLGSYLTYLDMVSSPVINNINRAYYLLNSLQRNSGFDLRMCLSCENEYLAIGLMETEICPACERNQYMRCLDCDNPLSNPYSPGRNGNKKRRCDSCGLEVRKKRRQIKRLKESYYVKEHRIF